MLKSPIFWSGVSGSLIIVTGTLLVPMLTEDVFVPGSLFVVVPLALLVSIATSMVLSSVFGVQISAIPIRKMFIDGYAGIFAGFLFGLFGAIVFLLPF